MKTIHFIALFIIISVFNSVLSQDNMKFKCYSKKEGYISNYTYCIAQDSRGFLWFGTKGGVSRFDGYEFKNYSGSNEFGTFAQGWTRQIVTDKQGHLWFGCMTPGSKSLIQYDHENDIFLDYEPKLTSSNLDIISLLCDKEGKLWVGTAIHGLFCFHPDSLNIMHIEPDLKDESALFPANINTMIEDNDGNIWVGTSKGLCVYNRETKSFIRYKNNPDDPKSLLSNVVERIYQDRDGDIWIGLKDGGLYRFIQPDNQNGHARGTFERILHDPDNPFSLPNNTVFGLFQDSKKRLWVGTLNGLGIMDKSTMKFTNYHHDEQDNESIISSLVKNIFQDKTGNMWVATSMGIAKQKDYKFRSFLHSSKSNSISHNKVDMLFQDSKGYIWIGSPQGLDVLDTKNWRFEHVWSLSKDFPAFFNSNIDYFWLIDKKGELYQYDCISRQIDPFPHKDAHKFQFPANNVIAFFVDRKKTLGLE